MLPRSTRLRCLLAASRQDPLMNMYPFASRKYFELFMKDVYGQAVWKRLHGRSVEEVVSKLRAADIAEWDQICSKLARAMAKKLCCHVRLEELWLMTGAS